MKNKFMRSLSAILAVLLAMTLSFAVLAESAEETSEEATSVEETSVETTSEEATSAESSAEASVESSTDATAEESKEASTEESKETSSEASKETSTETSKDASNETNNSEENTDETTGSNFPWARVITLIVIVVLVVVAIVLSKTNTALGQRIAKFFKEYASEIKKVSWLSPKDTVKSTAIVLVFILVAALVIGILDYLFGNGISLLAQIF